LPKLPIIRALEAEKLLLKAGFILIISKGVIEYTAKEATEIYPLNIQLSDEHQSDISKT